MAKKNKSEVLTVMFVDIVSYTKTTANLDRENFNYLHDVFDTICHKFFKEHEGKVIKKIGDAFLVTFKSATEAVLCGINLQNSFYEYNQKHRKQDPLKIRVALHSGEILHRHGDIYGDAVNTAARVEGITKANHVVFSEPVYAAMNKNEMDYIYLGAKKLKGLQRPLKVFRVKTKMDEILDRKKRTRKFFNKIKRKIVGVVVLGVVVIAIFLLVKYLFG
ncbi:adenylate/guanylate cyclase domain-containing protein [Candidatus Woesearchaeota archaeon]|nr:adenylate/guanylate cyclase domain-containing protein [Candidatus Woesearchaeota archaeon]MBT4111311.1 adenylate/guanylate cyclase domain-containing protein [Candidatus Woesearchaeota archaeon]MBT4335778.1 adenylate/guanylate cyclase domain-containing protein [Candidatus Woesearchaeota archaeon]MBT4469244.1 adenylate/guanylate cyclase domain-containing protein [Candidatus Woesearchaeota archaeon]MBT6744409.1 adenylate/guanylate cyclase domain-containing protein [Candidatus Woesearchaeota arc